MRVARATPSERKHGAAAAGLGELGVIRAIARRAAAGAGPTRELQLGIGDDCAILRPRPGEDLVVTTDFSLEGRHFRRDWHSAESVGHRTLARGLSDLAAMGARPVAAFLSLALPAGMPGQKLWMRQFLDGLLSLARAAEVPLAGGDTAEAPSAHVLADILLLGAVSRGRALRRDGAHVGDRLYVTGSLGGAAAQLRKLQNGTLREAPKRQRPIRTASRGGGGLRPVSPLGSDPHFFPAPRLRAGLWLGRPGRATAAIDVSDGLSTDLHHLCVASGVAAELHGDALPLSPLLGDLLPEEALSLALHGGEDYELLFTAPPSLRLPRRAGGVALHAIGDIVASRRGRPRVALVSSNGRRQRLRAAGWEHLR